MMNTVRRERTKDRTIKTLQPINTSQWTNVFIERIRILTPFLNLLIPVDVLRLSDSIYLLLGPMVDW